MYILIYYTLSKIEIEKNAINCSCRLFSIEMWIKSNQTNLIQY